MYIQLEQKDYDGIAELIAEKDNTFNGYLEYGEPEIEICFSKCVHEHQEDDYHKGTGGWVVDSVDFTIHSVECGEIEVKYDAKKLDKTINEWLWKA